MKTMIIIREIINIYGIELSNKRHNIIIDKVEIKFPIHIDKKLKNVLRFEIPAIKLPVQTPVNGNGTETKAVNNKY